ncbi:MAG: peptidoglycan bridge formation glycyltransferase FemA/FemB family protein [Nanoarchaeota archaeon]|nr:peptidoglycan bridge formation glycyltransferase FemA/FemB family protein [Nanoarchaeota archaeon]MBU0977073.1 peptidoglycan bridge formation glycyltransferase FemA/FemB family protein [Nanoarchaeota archaeon]
MAYIITKEVPEWWDSYADSVFQSSAIIKSNPNRNLLIMPKKKKGIYFSVIRKRGKRVALCYHPKHDKSLLNYLKEYARENKLILLIQSFYDLGFLKFPKEKVATVEVNLAGEVWSALDKKTRNQIRKAGKNGVEVRLASDIAEYKKFYNLLKETATRKKFDLPDWNSFSEIFHQKSISSLFIALYQGKLISGAVVRHYKKRVTLSFAGTDNDFYSLYPSNLIYWKVIEYGKKNNYEVFDLGGYELNAKKGSSKYGINKFKEGYGKVVKFNLYCSSKFYLVARRLYGSLNNLGWLKR